MKYTLFSGCLVQTRFPEYEISARLILHKLGLKFEFINDFSCCGSQILESTSEERLQLIAARNLALAEQKGIDLILTICGSCTYILKKSHIEFRNERLREKINEKLSKIGLSLKNNIRIKHLAEFLNGKEIFQRLKSELIKRIPLKLAFQNPCMLYRPEKVSQIPKDENTFIHKLLVECGAEIIPYEFQDQCCEGTMLAFKKKIGEPLVKLRHESIEKLGIDLFIVGCPNCQLVYSVFPNVLHSKMVPSVFLPQILGLSMGSSFDAVGLKRNIDQKKIKTLLEIKRII